MTNPFDPVVQKALALRINMQVSLSQLPIVVESMDIDLTKATECKGRSR